MPRDEKSSSSREEDSKEKYEIGGAGTEDATSFVPPTAEEERRVIRKLDFRLLPLVFVLYSLAVLDRSNLGNARLAGMEQDIDLSGDRYSTLRIACRCCPLRGVGGGSANGWAGV